MSKTITEQLDKLLADDKNFSTRSGLRFMTELVRDAFKFINDEQDNQKSTNEKLNSLDTRLGNVEKGLNDFLAIRRAEQEKNQSERTKWRWAFITPTIGLILIELFRWLTSRL